MTEYPKKCELCGARRDAPDAAFRDWESAREHGFRAGVRAAAGAARGIADVSDHAESIATALEKLSASIDAPDPKLAQGTVEEIERGGRD